MYMFNLVENKNARFACGGSGTKQLSSNEALNQILKELRKGR